MSSGLVTGEGAAALAAGLAGRGAAGCWATAGKVTPRIPSRAKTATLGWHNAMGRVEIF